jgi:hypothetical protein
MIRQKIVLTVFIMIPVLSLPGVDFSLSAGGGGLLGGLFTRYTLSASGDGGTPDAEVGISSVQAITQANFGGFLFFDATYGELVITVQGGPNTYSQTATITTNGPEFPDADEKGTGSELMLGFSLMGKYPFPLNERFVLFPLLGVEYQVALLQWRQQNMVNGKPYNGKMYDRGDGIREKDVDGEPYKLSAWNSLFVDIGAGLDFFFYPRMFLRTELLYGFRLMTPYEVDQLENVKNMVKDDNPKLAGLTSGPVLKLALGYRFR